MNEPIRTVICREETATRDEGVLLAQGLTPGSLVSLEGDLGAGKTVFVRGLAQGLGLDPEAITSPSFVLAIEHRGGKIPFLHADLYRLPEGAGIDDLGIEEALEQAWVVAVEWGERLPRLLRRTAWRVVIAQSPAHGETARAITLLPPEG